MSEEKNKNKGDKKNNKGRDELPKFNYTWIYILAAIALLGYQLLNMSQNTQKTISGPEYDKYALAGDVSKVLIVNRDFAEVYIKKDKLDSEPHKDLQNDGFAFEEPHYIHRFGSLENFEDRVDRVNSQLKDMGEAAIPREVTKRTPWLANLITYLVPIALFVALWLFILRRMSGGAGGPGSQIFNIGKSKATLFDNNTKVDITFADVAGLDEAKEEVMEVVDFLKSSDKYTKLGGKIPKGVLLVGPPGTGKTLLAKAVAGEAGTPFFSISGSDFVEMFVGVGASRVRDLFRQAREKAPCIIFIDEIDAIGRARGRGAFQGGNDERENTLNQLLVEMDGFPTDKAVILMAATNRPDILDKALLRPGRFDRQIGIGRPDLTGREQIFVVHLKNIKISSEVSPKSLAEMTPGFVGADIANVCNEAALVAARKNKEAVDMEDFNQALDRVIGGLEKKNKLISPEEKEIIAYHEAGHAICGWFLEHANPLVKVTIVPRGLAALGYAQYLPKEQYITRKEKLLDQLCMTLGGRAAEKVVFDKISTGAQSDLDHVTKLAFEMIVNYGLSEKIGNVSYYSMMNESYGKPFSEQTAYAIDQEVRELSESQYARAQQLLTEKRKELDALAKALLDKEVLLRSDLEAIIGPRPYDAKAEPSGAEVTHHPEPEPLQPDL